MQNLFWDFDGHEEGEIEMGLLCFGGFEEERKGLWVLFKRERDGGREEISVLFVQRFSAWYCVKYFTGFYLEADGGTLPRLIREVFYLLS